MPKRARAMLSGALAEARGELLGQIESNERLMQEIEEKTIPLCTRRMERTAGNLRSIIERGVDPESKEVRRAKREHQKAVLDLSAARDAYYCLSEANATVLGGLRESRRRVRYKGTA